MQIAPESERRPHTREPLDEILSAATGIWAIIEAVSEARGPDDGPVTPLPADATDEQFALIIDNARRIVESLGEEV